MVSPIGEPVDSYSGKARESCGKTKYAGVKMMISTLKIKVNGAGKAGRAFLHNKAFGVKN